LYQSKIGEEMIQIRPHAPDYAESMARTVYVQNADDVLAYMRVFFPEKCAQLEHIAQRYFGRDHRNGWESWLITLRSSPLLWADGPVPGLMNLPPPGELGT
jgi:hypothetical protein